MSPLQLTTGTIARASLDPVKGREQAGFRPMLVVSTQEHLDAATTLVTIMPITTMNRHWPNHVPVTDGILPKPSWIITEQVRTISRDRISDVLGVVDQPCLKHVHKWITNWLLPV